MAKYSITDITKDPHLPEALAKHGINPEAVRSYTLTDDHIEIEYYRYNTGADALAGRDMSQLVVVRLAR